MWRPFHLIYKQIPTCAKQRSNLKGEDFPSVLHFLDSWLKMTLAAGPCWAGAGAMLGRVGLSNKIGPAGAGWLRIDWARKKGGELGWGMEKKTGLVGNRSKRA
jgi:hypothetical protein